MDKEQINQLLNSSNNEVNSAVKLIYNYQQGKLKPIKTSLEHLNNMSHGGLFPGMIITICARSGHGKSYTAHTLRVDILNSGEDVGVLMFNWEMTFFNLILVEIRKRTGLSYKEILNLKNPTKEQQKIFKEVGESFRHKNLTTISQALTPTEFDTTCRAYIENNKDKNQLVIMVDHIGITKGSDKGTAMGELVEVENQIKLDYPGLVTFINLAQLNRKVDTLFRSNETNPLNLRLSPEFIYNSDALMQYSDLVIGQVIPDKFNMQNFTAVNTEKFSHLDEHFSDKTHKKNYTLLKAENRIYFDYIKPRLEDGQPTLYGTVLDEDKEELLEVETMQQQEIEDIEF